MVDMLQYDRNEVRVEGSVDVSEQEVPDLDIQIETESIVNDSFFDIVSDENKIPTPRRRQNRLAKMRERKVFDLSKILEKLEAKEKEKILNKSLESSSSHMHEFTEATLKYLCQLIKNARRSFASKVEGAKILERIFGERLHDIDFQLWLVEKFWLKDREELLLFLEFAFNDDIFKPHGRRFLSVEERQRVYDFWKLNSEVTVHRSNDCHIVKINLENVRSPQVADLEDDNTSLINTMRRKKKQAHKHVTTKCYKTLHSDYKQIYGPENSYGSFVNLKPFYVSRPTNKETEMCLCSKC